MSLNADSDSITTFTEFNLKNQRKYQGASGDFTILLDGIITSLKAIAYKIREGELNNSMTQSNNINKSGDNQYAIDIVANNIFLNLNKNNHHLAAIASEELEGIFHTNLMNENETKSKYLLVIDPLDGSGNIPVNGSIGTIFSILSWNNQDNKTKVEEKDFYQKGSQQICAGYVLYGASTNMVIANNEYVAEFTLDTRTGTFLLVNDNLTIPQNSYDIIVNMSRYPYWDDAMKKYINTTLLSDNEYNMRWDGSAILEVNRILHKGGVFIYSSDSKYTNGKLRKMYEVNPLSFIIEKAGGLALGAELKPALNTATKHIHEKTSIIAGSKQEVEKLLSFYDNK